jgi:hypothetical protein
MSDDNVIFQQLFENRKNSEFIKHVCELAIDRMQQRCRLNVCSRNFLVIGNLPLVSIGFFDFMACGMLRMRGMLGLYKRYSS